MTHEEHDSELAENLAALKCSMEGVRAGRSQPMKEAHLIRIVLGVPSKRGDDIP